MKQIKVLGVIAIALTLGLTACGGKKSECKKHDFGDWEIVTAATCTTDGSQKHTCKVCGKEETKVIKAAHTWGQWAEDTPATCAAGGVEKRTCSVCQQSETRNTDPLPHTYPQDAEGNDIITWTTEPSCDAAGAGTKTCSECGHVEDVTESALGHDFKKDAEGNIEFTWTKEPTCTKPGQGTKHCERCGKDIDATAEEAAALNHDLELIGGEETPAAGEAAVRVYHCKRCGEEYLGFLANEVSSASKDHVRFEPETVEAGQEQGARFLGRPIGNALALDATGTSVNQQNGECVYCSSETGDFIEYVFTLNATQAAKLQNCRLYTDAKPADYLNGTDFWAYGASNDEWTPGFYIDGDDSRFEKDETTGEFVMTDDHERATEVGQAGAVKVDAEGKAVQVKKGKRIEDYRYVLYVDDKVQDFDPTISNPTHGNNTNMRREEFVMPYTFNLHEGQNKIKLVMAGGYRSLFYSFVFRPFEEPENPEHVHQYGNEKAGSLEKDGFTTVDVYNCKDNDASALRWDAKNYDKDLSNAIEAAASDGSIRFDHAQGKGGETDKGGHLVYKIDSPVAAKDVELQFYIQAHSQNVAIFDAVANDSGAGKDVDADGKYTVTPTKRYALYVNDTRIELGDDPGASTAKAWFTFPCKFDLNKGENKIEIVCLGGYRAKMYNFQLAGLPKVNIPVKTWSSADIKASLVGPSTLTEKDFNNSLPGVKGYKFNKADTNCTLTVNMAADGTFNLELLLGVKKGNQSKTGFWYQVDSTSSPLPAKDKVTVNGVDVVPPENDVTFEDATVESDQSDNGTLMVPVWKTVCEVSLKAGDNTIVISYLSGGYSLYLCGAQLSK